MSIMDVRGAIEKVEQSSEFLEWKKNHEESFLASMLSLSNENQAILNYYDKSSDRMFSFSDQNPKEGREEEFLRKSDVIEKIRPDEVKVTSEEALKSAGKVAEENYSEEKIIRTITVLQVLDSRQIWNITFITANYKTINIRIDSSTGEVILHNRDSLVDFM